MILDVIWSGRGALPYPPGRSEDDDIRYQQRLPQPDEWPAKRERVRAEQRQLAAMVTTKCNQCLTRFVTAGEVRKGHSRCKVCRAHTPRRGGQGRRKVKE